MTTVTGSQSAPVEVRGATRLFGGNAGIRDVDLVVHAGEVHALLGPNGAGKTTLLRILAGLLAPTSGSVRLIGEDPVDHGRELRRRIGLVPAGDRSFYLRVSALENLTFFARLYGLGFRAARARSREVLDDVGLGHVAQAPRVGLFSHGMQKRLSVARALLGDPAVMLVDEATHDLDPEGALNVREIVARIAANGAAVVWATQRLDEIRGFAGSVTLLRQGTARFTGSVDELAQHVLPRRYVLRLANGGCTPAELEVRVRQALDDIATISSVGGGAGDHYLLDLAQTAQLGDAVGRILAADVEMLACRHETSDLEQAFLALVESAE